MGIGLDRLGIARSHDPQHHDDDDGDGERQADCRQPAKHQDPHHLFGRVGRGADVVAAKDGERLDLGQPLVLFVLRADGPADESGAQVAQR